MAGFTGNGFTCLDINECVLRTHACSGNATCTNTVGSYTCHCKTGFTGNGFICTVVTVILEGLQIDVTESTSNATVLVKVTGIRERNIHLNVFTYDVTAMVDMNDYETRSELVVFKPNNFQVPFSVRIFDDNLVEHTEQFGVRVTSSDPEVNVVNGDILVSIRDNDKITLSIDRSVYRVNEDDEFVSVKVVVTGKTAVAITGSVLRTADETAENPHDYTSVSQNLEIMPGEDSKNVTIAIKDDQLTEEPENIIVELTATNTNQISIARSSAIVQIHDDDDSSDPSSQEKSIGIIIGVSVAAVIVLVTVILIVARFICRRKEGPDNTRNIGDIQNAAYEGDKQPKRPKMPKKPHSEHVYDEPTVYAQLDSSTRVPIDANYQSLNKEGCGQLKINQNESVQPYASLSNERYKVPGKPAQGIYMTP
ncbi:microneme MIC12 [Paramuricea clavata]|nr:microneme MIC12 [Paramuricea clavata]